jgi:hypothetical protein
MSIWDSILGLNETHISTQTQPMFDVENLPKATLAANQRSLAWGTDRFDEYMREVKNGYHNKIDRAYEVTQNITGFGTPYLSGYTYWSFVQEARDIHDASYGTGVNVIKYELFGPLHPLFAGFHTLFNLYDFDFAANEIPHYSTQVGHTCYLTDMVAHYDVLSLVKVHQKYVRGVHINPRGGPAPSRPYGNEYAPSREPVTGLGTYGVEIFYEWVDSNNSIQTASEFIDLTPHKGKNYAQCIITKNDGDSGWRVTPSDNDINVWLYEEGTGTYPALDNMLMFGEFHGKEYFPHIVFRQNKKELSPTYIEGIKDITDALGLDYGVIKDQIYANPDIDDIESAALTLAVPAESDNQADLEYLYKYFEYLHDDIFNVAESRVNFNNSGYNLSRGYRTTALEWDSKYFDLGIKFEDIRKVYRTGFIAPVGKYALITGVENHSTVLAEAGVSYGVADYSTQSIEYPTVSYCYQALPGLYIEIKLVGLTNYFPIGSRTDAYLSSHENCVIPVNMVVAKELSWSVRNEFYTRNFRFIFNAKIVEKLKWYQTGIFKVFMGMVAIVTAVIGIGNIIATIGSIISASTITAAAVIVGNFLGQLLILKLLGIVIVEVLGPEYAFILSVVLLTTGVVAAGIGTNLPGLVDPNLLIGAVSGIQMATQSELKHLFNEYSDEYQSFLEESNSKLQELEDIEKELNLDLLDSPFQDRYTVPLNLPDETPEQYFARTIHTGNVGSLAYKTIENFVSSSLTLSGIERDPRIEVKVYV